MTSRVDTISKVFDAVTKPVEITGRTPVETVGRSIRKYHEDMAPGELGKLVDHLPFAHRVALVSGVNTLKSEREYGRHSAPTSAISERCQVPSDILEQATDIIEREDVISGLLQRRGSDLDLGLPPLTRKDAIAASIDSLE